MRHIFVINPHSFRAFNNLPDVIREIEDCFSGEKGDSYKIHISRYPRDAIAVVSEFISDGTKDETVRVYAVGGDGILFECLNGMVDFPHAELSCIPYGSANDFIRAFGEGLFDRFRDIKGMTTAPSRPMDIIHCGSNYALTQLNIGLIGQTIIYAHEMFPYFPAKWLKKNVGLAYSICGFRGLFNKAVIRQRYTISMDGKDVSGQYSNIHIANIACNGGSLSPSPYAKPDDGILQALMVNNDNMARIAITIGEFNKGHFERYDFIHHRGFKTMEITSDELLYVEMDGEGFYARELKVAVIPGGVKVFAPEELDFADHSYKAYKKKKGGSKI